MCSRTIIEDPPRSVCEVYLWDRPCRSFRDPDGPAFSDSGRLRVSTNPAIGWGALNYQGPDANLSDSYNPDASEHSLVLPLDTDGIDFPRLASLPLDQVREAVAQYCRTGLRPTCVQWQLGEWY
ncbi:Imm1 family immunity protein [Saccharopolyspora thermophila]|uniref:Imm1 family immunity protein n=1 Tax=Saccharopolyspora thermophila TaxID=89367 RepID=UPI001E417613|nr:Imm1 family immunity protein [Saccharopolyspora subtropica]